MTEHDLQNEIRIALNRYGMTLRLNVGNVKTADGRYFNTGLPRGTSDLQFIGNNGTVAFIEVKLPGRKPSPEQKNFIQKIRSCGLFAGVAHSVDEAIKIIGGEKNYGI